MVVKCTNLQNYSDAKKSGISVRVRERKECPTATPQSPARNAAVTSAEDQDPPTQKPSSATPRAAGTITKGNKSAQVDR